MSILKYLLIIVTLFSVSARAHKFKHPSDDKPYLILVGPQNMNEVRVHLSKKEHDHYKNKYEIDFGDGTVIKDKSDVFHQYKNSGKYTITVKTQNHKNTESYTQVVDINSAYKVKEIENTLVFNQNKIHDDRKYRFAIAADKVNRLYKVTLTQEADLISYKCYRDLNIEINDLDLFRRKEVDCQTKKIERFVWLEKQNTLQVKVNHHRRDQIGIEIQEVEISKDSNPPKITTDLVSNTLTRNNSIHVNVKDDSTVKTYVWNNTQELLYTFTDKEFDLPLNEGVNNYVLQAIDDYQNKSEYLYLSNITKDTQAPNINVLTQSQYIFSYYPQNITLNIYSDENLEWLSLNNVPATQVGLNHYQYVLTVSEPMSINLEIRAIDWVGNETIKTINPIFDIDNIAPTINSPLASQSYTNQNTFQVTVVENSTATTEVYLNNELIKTTTDKNLTLSLTNEGLNSFVIKSKDEFGNEAVDLRLDITYDITAPVLSSNLKANYFSNVLPFNVPIRFTSNEKLKKFITGTGIERPEIEGAYTVSRPVTAVGTNTVRIFATDLAGNTSEFNQTFMAVLDVEAPVITLNELPPVSASITPLNIQVMIQDLGTVSTTIIINGNSYGPIFVKNYNFDLPVGVNGTFDIDIYTTDSASNRAVKSFSLLRAPEVSPPVIEFLDVPRYTNLDWLEIKANIIDDSEVSTEVYVNDALVGSLYGSLVSYWLNLETDGTYNIKFVSKDSLNNEAANSIIIIKDTSPLKLTVQSPGVIVNGQLKDVIFGANKHLKKAYVNNVEVPIGADLVSVQYSNLQWNESGFLITLKVEDQFGDILEKEVQVGVDLQDVTGEQCSTGGQ